MQSIDFCYIYGKKNPGYLSFEVNNYKFRNFKQHQMMEYIVLNLQQILMIYMKIKKKKMNQQFLFHMKMNKNYFLKLEDIIDLLNLYFKI